VQKYSQFTVQRYSPLVVALSFKRLLAGFRIVRFDTLLWVFTGIAKQAGFGFLECPNRELTWHLDRFLQPQGRAVALLLQRI